MSAGAGGSWLLALLPPPELAARVRRFRALHAVSDAAAEPHITVRSHVGLSSVSEWKGAAAVAARTLPPACTLGRPQVFANRSALYLPVEGAALIALHLALQEQFPGGAGYEGQGFTPHLTLALARRGVRLPVLQEDAQTAFGDLAVHPLRFTASFLTLMYKPGPGSFYRPVESWAFGTLA